MTLPDTTPTRKQRFDAALKLAGLKMDEWLVDYGRGVTPAHLWKVLIGERTGGPELNAAIDELIEKYLPSAAA